jgi:AraC-like DNA-binding protein
MRSASAVDVLTDLLRRSRAPGASASRPGRAHLGPHHRCGRGPSVDGCSRADTQARARRHRARARVDPAADGARARRGLHPVRRPGARCHPAPQPRRGRRPSHGVLLRRLRLRGRPCAGRCWTRCLRRSSCGRRRGARCGRRWTCSGARCCATSPDSRRCSTGCSTWRWCRCCASFSRPELGAPAWFRASGDAHVGAARRAVHAEPARHWTVADLAAEAALSRSAFARRFTELLGLGLLAYLTEWRMALARERLRDTDDRLAPVARSPRLRLGVHVRGRVQAPPRPCARPLADGDARGRVAVWPWRPGVQRPVRVPDCRDCSDGVAGRDPAAREHGRGRRGSPASMPGSRPG